MTIIDASGRGIVLYRLSKSYGEVRAVRSIDLAIAPGETVALLGPNAAGKSTTIDMVLGLTRPDSGRVSVFGRTPPDAVAAGLVGGMLRAGSLLPFLSVRELVGMVASLYPRPIPVAQAPGYLRRAMESGACGFVVKDAPPEQLADAIRRVAAGERVVDPVLAAETLASGASPLTARERDVLVAARPGATVAEIAGKLFLAEGTVRNYLSAAIAKSGARNRAEAVRTADQRGWL
jgi:ABC-type cobalamin/Fe3+-siderophores transport system ATPase subunit